MKKIPIYLSEDKFAEIPWPMTREEFDFLIDQLGAWEKRIPGHKPQSVAPEPILGAPGRLFEQPATIPSLNKFVANEGKSSYGRMPKLTRDQFFDLHHTQKLSVKKIAKQFGCSTTTIHKLRKVLGVPPNEEALAISSRIGAEGRAKAMAAVKARYAGTGNGQAEGQAQSRIHATNAAIPTATRRPPYF